MSEEKSGVNFEEFKSYDIPVHRVHVLNEDASEYFKKPCGTYTTITTGPLDELVSMENICKCLVDQLQPHLEPFLGKPLCICGVGNRDIPADSLGPETVKRLTPHFFEVTKMQCSFSKVVAICPGVLGKTNLSTETAISSIAAAMDAACVLTVDSCATDKADQLCSTIQISDTGMDNRWQTVSLRQSTLGVPVVSVVVPTALEMSNLLSDISGLKASPLAPFNAGEIINTAALIIACAITQIVYPAFDYEDCKQCIETFAYNILP